MTVDQQLDSRLQKIVTDLLACQRIGQVGRIIAGLLDHFFEFTDQLLVGTGLLLLGNTGLIGELVRRTLHLQVALRLF